MIYRKKYIDLFHKLIQDDTARYFALVGPKHIGKTIFLDECAKFDVFGSKSEYQFYPLEKQSDLDRERVEKGIRYLIIDGSGIVDIYDIRTFIESLSSDIRVIFTLEDAIEAEDIEVFKLPTIGLREYIEHERGTLSVSDIFSGALDIGELNTLRDIYMKRGGYPEHLLLGTSILEDFAEKRADIYRELYEKEYGAFDSYLRTIAMNNGNLFKADQIAKLLNISRRKVNKYTELLIEHKVVLPVGPWVQDTDTETSRHVKLYFSDLSYLAAILGDMHAEGTLRQGATENLLFLELERKLGDTHTLYFYRKKSGAEIAFIAEDTTDGRITPIEVTTRSTDIPPQVFRVFDEEYREKIERYMIFNDTKGSISSLGTTQIMTLPHVGI